MRRLTRLITAGALLPALAAPSAALADSSGTGVHVDPGSPAGKQYAFPISSARSEASGGGGGGGSSSSSPPLFGAGATPGGGGSGGSGSRGGGSSASGGTSHSSSPDPATGIRGVRGQGGSGSGSPASVAVNAAAPLGSASYGSDLNGGGNGWVPLTIGGVVVLVLGGGGLVLRRRQSETGE